MYFTAEQEAFKLRVCVELVCCPLQAHARHCISSTVGGGVSDPSVRFHAKMTDCEMYGCFVFVFSFSLLRK